MIAVHTSAPSRKDVVQMRIYDAIHTRIFGRAAWRSGEALNALLVVVRKDGGAWSLRGIIRAAVLLLQKGYDMLR